MIVASLGCNCPECGVSLPTAEGRGNRGPRPGDIAMCDNCAVAFRLDENMQPRILTADEEHWLLSSKHGAYYETERVKIQRRGRIEP